MPGPFSTRGATTRRATIAINAMLYTRFSNRLRRTCLAALLAAGALALAATASEDTGESGETGDSETTRAIAIITHLDNPVTSVTRSELARIFMRTQTTWPDNSRCIPIDQRGDSPIRREFSRVILKKTVYEMKRYWMQETMTGNSKPPVSLEGAVTVKKYVQKIAGSVGYIYLDEVDETVRIVGVTDVEDVAKPPDRKNQTDRTERADSPSPPDPPAKDPP